MDEKVTEQESVAATDEEHETSPLIDAGAAVELTKGPPRGRWMEPVPIPSRFQ